MLFLLSITANSSVSANDLSTRSNRWETTLQMRYLDSTDAAFSNGSSVEFDSSLGWGLGFAYNLNERFSLGFDFSSANIDYKARVARQTDGAGINANGDAYTSTFGIVGTYYLLDRNFTPYLTAKVGSTYFDSGIPSGLPVNECYWWWYSYVCGTYQPTKSGYEMTYGGGVGVRLDVNRNFFMKGGVERNWIDIKTSNGTPTFDLWRLDLGLVF